MERFHKTVLDEFYRVAFRKTIYGSIAELQADLENGFVSCIKQQVQRYHDRTKGARRHSDVDWIVMLPLVSPAS